jgi:hypothetical protein
MKPFLGFAPAMKSPPIAGEANPAAAGSQPAVRGRLRIRSRPLQFLLHYLEMLAVMVAGMVVLGSALVLIASAMGFGYSELETDAPALVLAGMAFSMTAPMVWWMRRRGHSRVATRAMAIAMIAPSAAAIALLAGAVGDLDALLGVQHVAMLPAMAVAMLLHRGEYMHDLPST